MPSWTKAEAILARLGRTFRLNLANVPVVTKNGVKIPDVEINATDVKKIREKIKMSQGVFAKLLNVNSSSVKQWEQGKRNPSGSTKVLLELLKKDPEILNYRIKTELLQEELE